MKRVRWLLVTLLGLAPVAGCQCSEEQAPVTQPTPTRSTKPSPRVPKEAPKIKLDNIPLNIRSNAQVIFKDAKIGAGNFVPAKRASNGAITSPATAKLWTAIKGDPSTAQVTQVKVGDTFSVGKNRFKVVAINIPEQSGTPQPFVQSGGNKATITVVTLK